MNYSITKKQRAATVITYLMVLFFLCSHSAIADSGQLTTRSAITAETARPQGDQGKAATQSGQQLSPQSSGQSSASPATAVTNAHETKSEFEKYISGKSQAALSLDINQFGYELFAKSPSTFSPALSVPVGPDYVVGPGDTIKIDVWGKIEGSWNVVVNNDGAISLPKTGVLGVSGLSFAALKELLHNSFSKYYTGFEMNVSMGPLRTMQVYVVGNAQRPGVYTISSLSTVINALFEGGGPSKTGSMRNIQVKRGGRTVVTFDLYDLLLQGDKTKDLRLMPEDVIFIPTVGALAGIAGNVKTPAIFELKEETRLLDLIRMAGGLTGTAFKGRVQIQRIQDHQARTVFEGDLIDIETNAAKNIVLQDGDLAKIFTVVDTANTIILTGAVANPGEYAISPRATTINDVISLAGGLLYYTSDLAEITRVTVTQAGPKTEIFTIDLAKATAGDPQHNVTLQMNDYVLVRAVPEWNLYRTVLLNGEVRFPGTYTFKQGETLSSVIERAGGFTSRAYLRGAMFTREKIREQQQRQIQEMAERLELELNGSGTAQIATASGSDDARMVQMELEQKRNFITQIKNARAKGRIALNVSELSAFKGSVYDIELEQGDIVSIPSDPKTVHVIGSVYNRSAFVSEQDKEYRYYIDLAGGYTSNADKGNAIILLANGTAIKAGGGLFSSGERLYSGDTVVVPEQIERVAWMRNIKDITQIMYQIAVTAGVLLVVR
jgi:protein involved in polysaccharide export with SLBB domain